LDAYLKADKIGQARIIGQQLIDYDKQIHGMASDEYISSLTRYVDVLTEVGEVAEAERKLEQVRREVPEFARENGLLLSKLADVCTYGGKYSKAERLFFDALNLLRISDGEDSEIHTITLLNYAYLLMNQGKYDQTEGMLSEILLKSTDKEWFTADTYYASLNNMALVKHRLGQYQESEIAYRKLIEVDSATIGINNPDFAITLSNLGILHIDQSRYDDAEKVLKRAISILKSNKETASIIYAKTLNNLAKSYQRSGRYNEAATLLKQSLIIYEKHFGKESTEYAFPLFNLGTVYLYQKSKKALPTLSRVLSIRGKTLGKSHPLYAECEERIAQYYWMKKNKVETGQLYKNVFDNYYGQIDTYFPVLTEEEKSNFFFQKVKPSVETFSSFAIQSKDPQLLGQLFDYQVNTKGLILQATEKVRKSILSSGDSSLIALYEKWEATKDVLT
jgi:tetratricopeptide (TPR) repeat protein